MEKIACLELLKLLFKALFLIFFFLVVVFCSMKAKDIKCKEFSGFHQSFYEYFQSSFLTVDHNTAEVLPKLICFYKFTNDFEPEIMKSLCTHIIVGFFTINNENYSLNISNNNLQLLSKVLLLKNKGNNLKVLISVGGAGFQGFSVMVGNHTTRKMFIRGVIQFLKKFKIDGIDLDWEWPVLNGSAKEKIKFVKFLYEIKQEFNQHKKQYIISLDVSSIESVINLAYHVKYIAKYVDFVNVMCYDYHFYTKWYPLTGLNAPLYSSKSHGTPFFDNFNVNYSISVWISKSMPKEKIILGLPTYGHTFNLSCLGKNGLNAPANGYGSIGKDGFVVYSEVCKFIKQINTTVVFDSISQVPYAYKFPQWISYDNDMSVESKANYILSEGLGGAMIFSINSDDYLGICNEGGVPLSLTRKVRSVLFRET